LGQKKHRGKERRRSSEDQKTSGSLQERDQEGAREAISSQAGGQGHGDARSPLPGSAQADVGDAVQVAAAGAAAGVRPRLERDLYEKELARLQLELVKMQYWIKGTGFRLIVVFEGRDAAGKGGTIKRITEPLNPRGCRVVALGTPSDQQKTQWYFQRYVEHFPAAGEIVIFDRSWYNRAGVERVMGFCSERQVEEFLRACPELERMLVDSGILLLKYWFSVSDSEQEQRFRERIADPMRRWKLSPMDLEARERWESFSVAKDAMFARTNIPEAPWFTVEADDKRRARLNTIHHLLSKVPYGDMTPAAIELPPRKAARSIQRPPIGEQFFVPNRYP
jgi:polyphosphate kinase 2